MASTIPKRPLCYARRLAARTAPRPPPPPVNPDAPGILQDLIKKASNGDALSTSDNNWRPVYNHEHYIQCLKKSGHHKDSIEKIEKMHQKYYERNPPKSPPEPKPEEPVITHLDYIQVTIKEGDDESVKVTFKRPFRDFNGTSPEHCIDIYRDAGFSEEFVNGIIKKVENFNRVVEENNAHVDKVMSRYSGKSTPKAKKSNFRKKFTIKRTNILKNDIDNDDSTESNE